MTTTSFNTAMIDQLAKRLREPAWLTELRRQALARHAALPWPHQSDDIWRRTDVALLDPERGFTPSAPALLDRIPLTDARLADLTQPLGEETLFVRANGAWLTPPLQSSGVVVDELSQAAQPHREPIQQAIESDGLTEAEQKLSSLNLAFHQDDVVLRGPPQTPVSQPVRLVHVLSAGSQQALFPLTVITVGAGSALTLIDEYISVPQTPAGGPHLVNARIEIVLEPEASLHYVRLQRWHATAREFLLQRAVVGRRATLTMANLNLGAALSKAHLVTRLAGEHASTKLYGFVFGRDQQHIDQHTLQDHQAPNTTSDLQFRAALQDTSRMIYTGLIRIAKQAQHTEAFQANHNLLLSQGAQAETIPMLEILADDVQCKHGASIGPIDDEQAFYLMTRGIAREAANRLLVMGFVEPVIQQVPFAPLQERLRQEIEGGLHQA